MGLPEAERKAALQRLCGDDAALRSRIEELLRAKEAVRDFLTAPTATGKIAVSSAAQCGERAGDLIGPYRLLEKLGEGGFGSVHLAEQASPVRRQVALKVIKIGMDTAQVVARFEAERQALAMMDHPGIARVLDAGATEAGRPFFVMEMVAGHPLNRYCEERQLPLRRRLELFIEVCAAVQHAHTKGIIHRDLKPSNVLVAMLDGKPVPKIIDFGIAKATSVRLTEKSLHTDVRQLIGSPPYMSPEQAGGAGNDERGAMNEERGAGTFPGSGSSFPPARDVDTRSDIYSLGVMLYELLTGTTPFDAQRLRELPLDEVVRIIREEEPVAPSTRLGVGANRETESAKWVTHSATDEGPAAGGTPGHKVGGSAGTPAGAAVRGEGPRRTETEPPTTMARMVRGDLDWIVLKCLEKDRSRRYQTADALADDLQRFLNHEPVTAGPPTTMYRVRKFVRRNRTRVMLATVLLGALLLGMAGTGSGLVWALRERAEAIEARHAEVEQRRLAEESEHRAKEEAARALAAEAAERERADELAKVADFQASQLSDLDVPLMGIQLRASLFENRRGALAARQLDEPKIEEGLRELEHALSGINFTDVALGALNRTIFERALKAIDEQLTDQPLLRARLLQTLSESMRQLGLLDRAVPPQVEALEIRRSMLGDERRATITSVLRTADLFMRLGRYDDAEEHTREAFDAFRRTFGEEHVGVLSATRTMGALMLRQGRYDEAEYYLREAVELARRVLGDEHHHTLNCINSLAVLMETLGRYEEAEAYHRECLAVRRQTLGNEHRQTRTSLHNLGVLMRHRGRFEESEHYLREALDIAQRTLGDDHPKTLNSMNSLAVLLRTRGRFGEAEAIHRDSIERLQRTLGAEHPQVARSITNMGSLLQQQGKLADAESYCREALELSHRIFGNAHPTTLVALTNLADVLVAQGNSEEGVAMYRRALEASQRIHDGGHPELLRIANNLGSALVKQGRLAEAETLHQEVLETCRRIFGDDHPSTLAAIHNMADVLQRQSSLDDAERLYGEWIEAARRVLGDDHPSTLAGINNIGLLRLARDDPPKAAEILAVGVAAARDALGEHPLTAALEHHHADALHRLGHTDEAIELAEAAVARYRTNPAWDRAEFLHALRILQDSLLTADRQAEAMEVMADLVAQMLHPTGSPVQAARTMRQSDLAIFASLVLATGEVRFLSDAESAARAVLHMRDRRYADDHPNVWRRYSAASLLGGVLLARAQLLIDSEAAASLALLREAESLLLPTARWMLDDPRMPTPEHIGGTDRTSETVEQVVRLHELMAHLEPAAGHDEQAAYWQSRLAERQSASSPSPDAVSGRPGSDSR